MPRTPIGAHQTELKSRKILGMRVDATSYDDAVRRITRWARAGKSRYVCIAAVNNVMQAHDDPPFMSVMNSADLVTPDGMPLVWGLRRLGVAEASRVYGPDLTPAILSAAEEQGIPVGFFGGAGEVLPTLLEVVKGRWPALEVSYSHSPPFRAPTPAEEDAIVDEIDSSGARILLVGLGCPKQEYWMARHKGRLQCVSVGVGAAFDFIAGTKKQAPPVMQRSGTEWLYRLLSEPKRLWKRYLLHNPRFMALFGVQLVRRGRVGTT